jgi:LmbE family N-acetylglucosaminyl deacetylase
VIPQSHHLAHLFREISPDVVITHPYEGGHPDHDSAALIARLASDLVCRSASVTPDLLEMTSYHARDGHLITGEFLPLSTEPSLKIELRPSEVNRKKLMIRCYHSQSRVLQSFGVDTEMLRIAPLYDFSQPPHAGRLWYECLGWPMTGSRWRSLAADAISQLELRCA